MGEEPVPANTTSAVAAADDAFGADLYRLLTENATETVFSPVSVATALRMALCGARGRTAAELPARCTKRRTRRAEGCARPRPLRPRRGRGRVRDVAGARHRMGTVRPAATSRVHRPAGGCRGGRHRAGRLRRGARGGAGRDQPGHRRADRGERSPGCCRPRAISDLTRLVLTSAVYLKAAWAEPFPEAATRDAPFYPDGPDRPSLTVPMMRGAAARSYLRQRRIPGRRCCPTRVAGWRWPWCCRTGRWRRCGP